MNLNLELPPEVRIQHLPNIENKFGRVLFTHGGTEN